MNTTEKAALQQMAQALLDIKRFFDGNGGSFPLSPQALISDNDLTIRENVDAALAEGDRVFNVDPVEPMKVFSDDEFKKAAAKAKQIRETHE